jgi:hypothetical protein
VMADRVGNRIELPSDKELASQVLTLEYSSRVMERGWMGRIFGSVADKPGNIAGFAIVAFSAMFAIVLFWGTDTPSLSKKDALVLVGGFVTLTLGFIFGRSTT